MPVKRTDTCSKNLILTQEQKNLFLDEITQLCEKIVSMRSEILDLKSNQSEIENCAKEVRFGINNLSQSIIECSNDQEDIKKIFEEIEKDHEKIRLDQVAIRQDYKELNRDLENTKHIVTENKERVAKEETSLNNLALDFDSLSKQHQQLAKFKAVSIDLQQDSLKSDRISQKIDQCYPDHEEFLKEKADSIDRISQERRQYLGQGDILKDMSTALETLIHKQQKLIDETQLFIKKSKEFLDKSDRDSKEYSKLRLSRKRALKVSTRPINHTHYNLKDVRNVKVLNEYNINEDEEDVFRIALFNETEQLEQVKIKEFIESEDRVISSSHSNYQISLKDEDLAEQKINKINSNDELSNPFSIHTSIETTHENKTIGDKLSQIQHETEKLNEINATYCINLNEKKTVVNIFQKIKQIFIRLLNFIKNFMRNCDLSSYKARVIKTKPSVAK